MVKKIVSIDFEYLTFVKYKQKYLFFNLSLLLKTEISFNSQSPRFPKEHCFLEGSEVPPVCLGKSNVYMDMNMERWWNNTDSGEPKYSEKNCLSAALINVNYTQRFSSYCAVITPRLGYKSN